MPFTEGIAVKRGYYDLDNFCDTRGALAPGTNQRLHDWRIHSCPACHRNRCGADQNHSGTQTVLTVGIKEG